MHVENVRIIDEEPSAKGFQLLCLFDFVFSEDFRLHGVQLIQAPEGGLLVYPPHSKQAKRPWSCSVGLREKMIRLASAALLEAQVGQAARMTGSRGR